MSASKGIRLWLRPARKGRPASYIIRDGEHQRGTGCGPGEIGRANQLLADYIKSKHKPDESRGKPLHLIPAADVISAYQLDVIDKGPRVKAGRQRLKSLLGFFGGDTLSEINSKRCREYADHRRSQVLAAYLDRRRRVAAKGQTLPETPRFDGTQAARKELEDLRAAINHWFEDEAVQPVVNIELPDKAPPRERWLTEKEAVIFLRAAWRKRQGMPKGGTRRVAQHIARFIIVGLYTGSRSGAICGAAIRPTPGRGYVDLEHGVFYRRPPGTRETNKRQPPVRLPEKLLSHLRRWVRRGLCRNCVIEWEGEPVKRVSKAFKRLVDDLGFHGVTPHTLRHTGISWALQRGAKPWDVSDYFGVSEKVIIETYGHHDPEHHREVTRRMDRRHRAAPVAPPVAMPKQAKERTAN